MQSSKALIQSMSGVSYSRVCHLFKKLCHIPSSLPHPVSTTGPTVFSTRKLSLTCLQIYTSLSYAIHLWFCLYHTFKILGTLIIQMIKMYLFPSGRHAAAAKSLQSCPTLCDPIDGSPPGFPVPGILQARTLEWGAISFSNA